MNKTRREELWDLIANLSPMGEWVDNPRYRWWKWWEKKRIFKPVLVTDFIGSQADLGKVHTWKNNLEIQPAVANQEFLDNEW